MFASKKADFQTKGSNRSGFTPAHSDDEEEEGRRGEKRGKETREGGVEGEEEVEEEASE